MKTDRNILICPLEWGLGHAARMIPLAVELRKLNYNVTFASGEEHLSLLRSELPDFSYILFTGFKPRYSRWLPQYVSILFKIPNLVYHIIREHQRLKKIIRDYSIDIVISDNRFGLWNKQIKTVYVTHMPLIPFPRRMSFLEPIGVLIHRAIIRKFTYCFIPDLPGKINISGRLSHNLNLPGNVRYTGILSRFSASPLPDINIPEFRYNTVLLSGPEPQKEILKEKLIRILKNREPVTIFLEGKPGAAEETRRVGNIILYNHLPAEKMRNILAGSEGIISRSGYTTIMDLLSLNCSALLIPTPGQTEQEYLAEYMTEKGWFTFISQHDVNEGIAFPSKGTLNSSAIIEKKRNLLSLALKELSEVPHNKSQSKIANKVP